MMSESHANQAEIVKPDNAAEMIERLMHDAERLGFSVQERSELRRLYAPARDEEEWP